LVATLDATREDILRSLQARAAAVDQGAAKQPRRIIVGRTLSHLPDDRADEFHERFQALMEEFEAADTDDATQTAYALTVAFYPSFYFREEAAGQPGDTPAPASSAGQ
jgi:hypothetical protein